MPAHHFDNVSDAALNKANKTILLLKELRNRLYRVLSIPREFFDVDVKLDHASRQTVERKLKFFQQTAFLQAKFVQHEYKLKLIACLDGYLAALQAGMPTIIYLSARHLLELIATVAYLDDELRSAVRTDLRNWQGRALLFFNRPLQSTLCLLRP